MYNVTSTFYLLMMIKFPLLIVNKFIKYKIKRENKFFKFTIFINC